MDDGEGRARAAMEVRIPLPSQSMMPAGASGDDAALNPSPITLAASFVQADQDHDPGREFRSFNSLMSPTHDSGRDGEGAQAKNGMRVERGGSFAQRLAARGSATSRSIAFDRPEHCQDDVKPHAAQGNTMLPSRIPFSPSDWLIIPPGISPTLLDSPVLFSSYQAEPSPTTGSYNLPPAFGGGGGRGGVHMSPHSSESSKESDVEQESSSGFVFKHLSQQGALDQPPSHGNLTKFGISHPQFPTQYEPHGGSHGRSHASGSRMLLPCAPMPLPLSDLHLRSGLFPDRPQGISEGFPLALEDMQGSNQAPVVERPSEDGYNWRKYGQKQVKGSEFPRSYYKCTSANCPVKKKVERSHDGQVTEIVYKGEHNHGKPVPSRRLHGAASVYQDGSMRDSMSLMPSAYGKDEDAYKHHPARSFQGVLALKENGNLETDVGESFGSLADPGGLSYSDDEKQDGRLSPEDGDEEGFSSKRRRMEILTAENGGVQRTIREPRVVVQTISEIDILDDGYRWRKYGQKVVKGNPHPRSYYKCTNVGCPVRKHVERASGDPKSVITTYEGKHSHDVPIAKASAAPDNSANDVTSLLVPTTIFAPCVDTFGPSAPSGHDQATSFPRKPTSLGRFLEDDPRHLDMPMSNTELGMQLGIDHAQFCMGSDSKIIKQEAFVFSTSSFMNFADVFPSTEG